MQPVLTLIDQLSPDWLVTLIGLACGLVLGLAARVGRFCTLGALEDVFYGQDGMRLRAWAVAIGVALIVTHSAWALGVFDPAQTRFLRAGFSPVATVVGGLMFGYGMALAGNCGYGALARLGGGDLRSLMIVGVLGVTAYATQIGVLAPLRVWLFPISEAAAPSGYAARLGFGPAVGVGIGITLLMAMLPAARTAKARKTLAWGGAVGGAVALAWLGTSWAAHHSFAATPLSAPSFVAPVGETMQWTMTASAPGFDVGCVLGVVLGAFVGSYQQGRFRWEACDDQHELRRQIWGAALMGVGGVLALGCSIGQGLSAMSVLAFSAPLALAAIAAGAALGLKQLITGFGTLR